MCTATSSSSSAPNVNVLLLSIHLTTPRTVLGVAGSGPTKREARRQRRRRRRGRCRSAAAGRSPRSRPRCGVDQRYNRKQRVGPRVQHSIYQLPQLPLRTLLASRTGADGPAPLPVEPEVVFRDLDEGDEVPSLAAAGLGAPRRAGSSIVRRAHGRRRQDRRRRGPVARDAELRQCHAGRVQKRVQESYSAARACVSIS